jgi:hypothetical protein
MRQIRVTKERRTNSQRRRDALLDALPIDPRDPDIIRAKQRQRDGKAGDDHPPGAPAPAQPGPLATP